MNPITRKLFNLKPQLYKGYRGQRRACKHDVRRLFFYWLFKYKINYVFYGKVEVHQRLVNR